MDQEMKLRLSFFQSMFLEMLVPWVVVGLLQNIKDLSESKSSDMLETYELETSGHGC